MDRAIYQRELLTFMLRTMITETPFLQKWVLQGRLSSEWAVELKQKWTEMVNTRQGRTCVVDISDVISMDSNGESVLLQMIADGARMTASGPYMKQVLEDLTSRES